MLSLIAKSDYQETIAYFEPFVLSSLVINCFIKRNKTNNSLQMKEIVLGPRMLILVQL